MSAPISRPRLRAGCTMGKERSHPGKSGVCGPAMAEKAKKALREKIKWKAKCQKRKWKGFEKRKLI